MLNMGSWEGIWWVPGIALQPPTRYTPPRVHHLPTARSRAGRTGGAAQQKEVVGLISVDQLSLCLQISGFQGITEGYNLAIAGNPNDH